MPGVCRAMVSAVQHTQRADIRQASGRPYVLPILKFCTPREPMIGFWLESVRV
jgi:hypothetical protein